MSVGKKKSRRHRRTNGSKTDATNGGYSSGDSGSDEDPDVEDLESSEICQDNHTTCIGDNIDAVLEVFDEETS